jgi:hypothetical protein
VRWFTWVFVVACSSNPGTPTHPHPQPARSDAGVAMTVGPTEGECEELITHAIDLGMEHQRATQPPDRLPTEADREALRTKLRPYAEECRALPRDAYRCAIAATTTAELTACHATRSSSTSNSSVAPGGMTPPAPRSP